MGIIKSLEDVSEHHNISINEELYDNIRKWLDIYKGYHEDIHKVKYHTIGGGSNTRRKMTLNIAKTSAQEMASLIYNERCEISIGDGENDTAIFVHAVLADNDFDRKFQDHLEYMFAMGGAIIKPYYDSSTDSIKIAFIDALSFVPTKWSNDTIKEGVFINEFYDTKSGKRKKYTHLEWHLQSTDSEGREGYTIKHELYESTDKNDLGIRIPLSTYYPNLKDEIGIHPLSEPLFIYTRPNTANQIDIKSPLGVSIFSNAIDTLNMIDTAYDSLHREFRLGKKRILVPASMVQSTYDPKTGEMHRYFDPTDETYEAFDSGDMDSTALKDISTTLRVEEHISAINALLNWYAMQTGFSAGTFTFDGQSVKTATEVISENSKTFKSKQSHEILVESSIKHMVRSIINLAELYDLADLDNEIDIKVSFDDSVAEDKTSEINKQIQLVQAELQSKQRAISIIQGVTQEEALSIMEEIRDERERMLPDMDDIDSMMFGGSE